MTVHVLFCTPQGIGAVEAPGIGAIRIREAITVPGTTDAQAMSGEVVLIANEDGATILAAHGSTPDASALASTRQTSAGVPVQSGQYSPPLIPAAGSRVDIKAMS